jgi:hypothetical protein
MLLPLLGSALALEGVATTSHDAVLGSSGAAMGPLAGHPEWSPAPVAGHAPTDPWTRAPRAPPRWEDIPAAADLDPVRFDYGRRFQELLAGTMGGRNASPVFGPIVAEADVHWRLVEATGRGLPIDAERAATWRDASLSGSVLAATRVLDETLDRAPVLRAVWTVGDAILSPSIDARGSDEGLVVTHHIGGPPQRALERAEADEVVPPGPRKPPTGIATGLDWSLRENDETQRDLKVRYTAWLSGTGVGITTFRLEVLPISRAWSLSGREQVVPRVFLIGNARSVDDRPDPGRLSGGLMWLIPGRDNWNVRLERIVALDEVDTRWLITLRCENRTSIPAGLDPPLGDRGRPGTQLPAVPDRGPNTVGPW